MTIQIKTRHIKSTLIIDVSGQIDMDNYIEIHEIILNELSNKRPNIVLNLKHLDFMDSAALGMLLRSHEKAKLEGGGLVIISNPFVERVLSVTGLSSFFEICNTETEALKCFDLAA